MTVADVFMAMSAREIKIFEILNENLLRRTIFHV